MKLVFLNRYFYPDHSATSQMLSDMAFALARRGWNVHVITSRLRYDAPEALLAAGETVNGVQVHRVRTTRFGRRSLPGRALDYTTFYCSAAAAILKIARRGDIVVAKTDPPMLGILAGPLARLKGAAPVNWLQDIFPEVAEELTGRSPFSATAFRLLRAIRNRSLRRARMNVVIGERMAARVRGLGAGTHLRIIPNWTDCASIRPVAPADNPLKRAWGLQDSFVVGYSGNLGRAHEIETLLDAVGRLEEDTTPASVPIRWLFIGGGAQFENLKKQIEARSLSSVLFRPYQPRAQLSESLSVADVHLVSLRPELEGLIVPSKFYGIAAAGRATIFIGDSDGEIARLLSKHDCGLSVAQGDGAKLAETIRNLARDPEACRALGRRGREGAEAHFDLAFAVEAWNTALREMCRTDAS